MNKGCNSQETRSRISTASRTTTNKDSSDAEATLNNRVRDLEATTNEDIKTTKNKGSSDLKATKKIHAKDHTLTTINESGDSNATTNKELCDFNKATNSSFVEPVATTRDETCDANVTVNIRPIVRDVIHKDTSDATSTTGQTSSNNGVNEADVHCKLKPEMARRNKEAKQNNGIICYGNNPAKHTRSTFGFDHMENFAEAFAKPKHTRRCQSARPDVIRNYTEQPFVQPNGSRRCQSARPRSAQGRCLERPSSASHVFAWTREQQRMDKKVYGNEKEFAKWVEERMDAVRMSYG
ncbi:hypothetical protein NP493_606g02002 [Ridgeia piscesae]|uniref:Uncharacterized protein n=1 Tax=Ridgeia piscesae TaxID=27915 RepID=A0AAD9KUT5_RIDPI|nr:hypothetical protein NP493_606g02002 [Ridgeia piscesae]